MGSKEEDVPKEPIEKPVFVEDMNDSDLASAVSITKLSQLKFVYIFKKSLIKICEFIAIQSEIQFII